MGSNLCDWHVASAMGPIGAHLHLLWPMEYCIPNLQMRKANLLGVQCLQTSLRSEGIFFPL